MNNLNTQCISFLRLALTVPVVPECCSVGFVVSKTSKFILWL
jgi:hypothetical protein